MLARVSASGDWNRLATLVQERREELGRTQEEIAADGGPSTTTLTNVEGARAAEYRPKTLRKLEVALGWTRGSVERVLAGGDPELVDQPPASRSSRVVTVTVRGVPVEISGLYDALPAESAEVAAAAIKGALDGLARMFPNG